MDIIAVYTFIDCENFILTCFQNMMFGPKMSWSIQIESKLRGKSWR